MDRNSNSGVQGSEASCSEELSGGVDDVVEPQKQRPAQGPDYEAGLPPAAQDQPEQQHRGNHRPLLRSSPYAVRPGHGHDATSGRCARPPVRSQIRLSARNW
ncbi:hypothetical protein [Ornithinimicrobium kibberense]|uniref:hypothetical protein n=1 Tax=Ornithinimicrobium kibberense TaxID=282060 RepID=UPI003615AB00